MQRTAPLYVIYVAANHSPCSTVRDLRNVIDSFMPVEIHGRGYDTGGFVLLKSFDLQRVWALWHYLKQNGFNIGVEKGPTIEAQGGRRLAPFPHPGQDEALLKEQNRTWACILIEKNCWVVNKYIYIYI